MNASSTCALSEPVDFHCATKCFWLRFMICPAKITMSGITTTATAVRSGDTTSIMISTPTTVNAETMSWLSACVSDWPRLSMSLVTRESNSPRGCLSK